MCGIAGVVSPALAASGRLEPTVAAMLYRMRHRGPDGSGVRREGSVALGAARLSVVDTREIPQPVASLDGRFVIAYNGEAYNFPRLRKELEARGARFATDTDTEVVMEAYRAFGRSCLERLHGMFAFVLLDRETGELFGARDRLGKKPFFFHRSEGLFAFASFLPSLALVPGVPCDLDLRTVLDVLEVGYTLSPKTPWKDVEQLPPASGFILSGSRFEVFEYWSLAERFREGVGAPPPDVDRTADELGAVLREAVRERLIADVPLGALLSGGIDSSTIVELMVELSSARVQTFSVGFEEQGFDERSHAELVAHALGTEHHADVVRLDDPSRLERAQWHVGEPLADTSVLPTALVSEIARRRVTVALTGDGADELFAGYETFRADAVRGWLNRAPAWPVRPLLRAAARALPVDHGKVSFSYKARRFVSGLDLPPMDAHSHWRALQGHEDALSLLLPEARRELAGYEPVARFRELEREVSGCDLVNRCSYVDLRTYLLDDILVKVDRATMGWSLEGRCPFLDHPVVELAARLPGNFKLRGLTTKWILRRQQEGRLPSSTLQRRKEGFSAPVSRWLVGSLRDRFRELVTPQRMEPLGVDAAAAHRLHGRLERGEGFHGYVLWAVFVLALWDQMRTRDEAPPVMA